MKWIENHAVNLCRVLYVNDARTKDLGPGLPSVVEDFYTKTYISRTFTDLSQTPLSNMTAWVERGFKLLNFEGTLSPIYA